VQCLTAVMRDSLMRDVDDFMILRNPYTSRTHENGACAGCGHDRTIAGDQAPWISTLGALPPSAEIAHTSVTPGSSSRGIP